jgi:hypothetical protein
MPSDFHLQLLIHRLTQQTLPTTSSPDSGKNRLNENDKGLIGAAKLESHWSFLAHTASHVSRCL